MGGSTYSKASYSILKNSFVGQSTQEVFSQRKIHDSMSPMGLSLREARDSEAHPISVPIIIALDITGSMGYIPEDIIKNNLGTIVETIIAAGISDPAIMFIAIGDHISDDAPLQVGQFESGDKELVMWLERTWLEGNGGGTMQESYLLAWYLAAFHTVTDAWEKRQQKGILITIGDEQTHETLAHSEEIFGGQGAKLHHVGDLLELAREKWDIYHIHANDGSYPIETDRGKQVINQWKNLLGQKVIVVKNHKTIGTVIAETVIGSVKDQISLGKDANVAYDFELKKDNPESPEML
jgi:hypothetical protein